MMLQGEVVNLRALEPTDLDLLYQVENDPENWAVSHTETPYARYVLKAYLKDAVLDIYTTKQLRLVIDVGKRPVGLIDLFDFDPFHKRAGLGILVFKSERRLNYAKESVELLLNYMHKHLGLHQAYVNIDSTNVASFKLFEQFGFVEVGRKKDWLWREGVFLDEILFQKIF